jgi:peptide/nickel transport system permease protein
MRVLRGVLGLAGSVLVTLFGLVVVTFLIGHVMPIDPVIAMVGDNAPQDVVERVRHEAGLDRPLPVQFVVYVGQLLQGELGRSILTKNPVTTDLATHFPATMELASAAMILAALIGVPLGVWAAVRRGSFLDQAIRVVCIAGHSVPVFVMALLSLLVFYSVLDLAPGPGRQGTMFEGLIDPVTGFLTIDTLLVGDFEAFRDALAHLAQPASILAYVSMAYITRMTRAFMIDALGGEYVVTARAKGLSGTAVVWKHAFPNVAVRLVTVLALTYAGLLEGAVVTETVFAWPGLGQYLTLSLLNADMNAVIGSALLVGVIYVAVNLFADFLYRRLDPRVR